MKVGHLLGLEGHVSMAYVVFLLVKELVDLETNETSSLLSHKNTRFIRNIPCMVMSLIVLIFILGYTIKCHSWMHQ